MRKLDTVLCSGGTVPLDFTLHDAGHALRVARRMEELIPDPVRENLSDHELALLLLAAYGHDIGMAPERGKVAAHHRHLFAPDQSILDPGEKERFQKFLDEHAGQSVALPLTSSLADLNLADELVAYYVRDRHNDWSAEWLRESLRRDPGDGFSQLPRVVEVLVTLCSSHHWDFAALGDSRFDPFTVGSGREAQVIHLRYLACILRLADILENDPGRTPEVLFRHRGIADRGKSLVHWQKDHDLSITLGGDQLYFQARPRNARVHRALVQLADWIDHELHGIAAFGERLPAEFRGIKRHWHLTSALIRDIRPFDGSYEYIDGAFRPDTARLLQLLSGEQLYGNPLHAVRELLQNAFDAVREKIARKRLDLPDPADHKWEDILGNQEHVTLTLRPSPDGGWQFVCEDSGVGLNKELITNHVLVSGTGRRHAIRQLERDCEERGFRPCLTGQFGIGVLSYFMLADEVTLETTRYQGCEGRSESWHFTTRGVGSFGELRRIEPVFPSGGTRVTWGLRNDQVTDAESFAEKLQAYLKQTLVRLPCRFEFRAEGVLDGPHIWRKQTGWVKSKFDWLSIVRAGWKEVDEKYKDDGGYISSAERLQKEELKTRYSQEATAVRSAQRNEFLEVPLPAGLGVARLVLSFFELKEGRCLKPHPAFYPESDFTLHNRTVAAWKGMVAVVNPVFSTIGSDFNFPGVSVELDLVSSPHAQLGIDRETIRLSEQSIQELRAHLMREGRAWIDAVLARGESEFFHEVNLSVQKRTLTLRDGCGWYHAGRERPLLPLTRPFTLLAKNYSRDNGFPWRMRNSNSEEVLQIIAGNEDCRIQPTCEVRFLHSSDDSQVQQPCLYWPRNPEGAPAFSSRFPTEWKDVGILWIPDQARSFLTESTSRSLLNRDHPVVRALLEEEKGSIVYNFRNGLNIFQRLDDAVDGPAAAAAFCRLAIASIRKKVDHWDTYHAERSGQLQKLWELISVHTGQNLSELRLVATDGNSGVLLSPESYLFPSAFKSLRQVVPVVVDPDFLLYEVDQPT